MKPMRRYLGQARLVLALAGLFGIGLALVEAGLAPRIEANKQAETLHQAPLLVPGAAEASPARWGGRTALRALDETGAACGWIVPAAGPGFAGPIELLIGLDEDSRRLTGVYVLSQMETPGLGNRITEPDWLGQFRGHATAAPPTLQDIDGLSGATISSESVLSIVRATLRDRPEGDSSR